MAFDIVKKSLNTVICDIKKYIPVMISSFISSLIVTLLKIFTNLPATVLELLNSAITLIFIATPCLLIIYDVAPLQFSQKMRSVISIWVISLISQAIMLFSFSFVFPSQKESAISSLALLCYLVTSFISIVVNCAIIRIMKTDSSAVDAIFTNSDIFSLRKGFNIWLYIKLVMINIIFSIILSFCISIVEVILSIIPNIQVSVILTAIVSLLITLPYKYVYAFIELSNYYEEVLKV